MIHHKVTPVVSSTLLYYTSHTLRRQLYPQTQTIINKSIFKCHHHSHTSYTLYGGVPWPAQWVLGYKKKTVCIWIMILVRPERLPYSPLTGKIYRTDDGTSRTWALIAVLICFHIKINIHIYRPEEFEWKVKKSKEEHALEVFALTATSSLKRSSINYRLPQYIRL